MSKRRKVKYNVYYCSDCRLDFLTAPIPSHVHCPRCGDFIDVEKIDYVNTPVITYKCKPWSEKEIATLRYMVKQDFTYEEIGKELGRTKNGCSGKARELNLRPVKYWTTKEDEVLKRLYRDGYTYKEISNQLPGRTWVTCKGRMDSLRRKGEVIERKKVTSCPPDPTEKNSQPS